MVGRNRRRRCAARWLWLKTAGEIEVWGDGQQTRSFLYIDECVEGTLRLMRSEWTGPVNIGSDEMVTIDGLATMIMKIAKKKLSLKHIPGPARRARAQLRQHLDRKDAEVAPA